MSGTLGPLKVTTQQMIGRYLDLLHQPVLLLVIRLGELVDLDFVLGYFPHDLQVGTKTFSHS